MITMIDFNKRPLSWSAISSFEYSPEQWYDNYILGKKNPESEEMKFGKRFAESIEDGTCENKELLQLLQKKKEHKFSVVFSGIPLIGFADAFCDRTFKKLDEVKTGKKAWDQKRANEHGQISMYALMNFITNKVKPEDTTFTLYWCPTQSNGDFSISFVKPIKTHVFKTKRTMNDILQFGLRIKRIVKEMEEYCKQKEA